MLRNLRPLLVVFAVLFATVVLPGSAAADGTIRQPGDHPKYVIEIEPHGHIGWDYIGYGSFGFGAGVRFSIPFMDNGFVPRINNSPAISFGVDWMHYETCYYRYLAYAGYGCSANYFYFPVALQWNFFVARHWSVMAEPGFAPYVGTYTSPCDVVPPNQYSDCVLRDERPARFSVTPWINFGARYHFNDHVALTMRVGYPTFFSLGVSFM